MKRYEFVKLNDEPIEIECVEDEHLEENDFKPSFWWWNRRYFLENFVRTHNNPWTGTTMYDPYPECIHGMEADVYYRPLFIELVNGDEAVNVYEEREVFCVDIVEEAIQFGVIRFVDNYDEVTCAIGNSWFYFLKDADKGMLTTEYLQKYTRREKAEQIYDAIKNWEKYGLDVDEAEYYNSYIMGRKKGYWA